MSLERRIPTIHPRGRLRRVAPWWGLTVVGCLILLLSTQLPWATSVGYDGTITGINGFNSETTVSGSANFLAQLGSLTISLPDTSSQALQQGDSASDVIVLPGLNSIPPDIGGSDADSNWGILVFVPGAIALFISIWTLWGERERRRSMARAVCALGAVTVIPLLHQFQAGLSGSTTASLTNGPALSNGVGIFVGLAGVVVTVAGSALLSRRLGAPETWLRSDP